MAVIPFYGATEPDLFAIERRAMDRPGRVIDALSEALPTEGLVLDVGAGDGFTAERLTERGHDVVALEPAEGMIDPARPLHWTRGDAEHLPFADESFAAAYATWAYFFSRGWDPSPGIAELHRVVRRGGPLLVVDNLGGDEFCSLAAGDISADPAFWETHGFSCTAIDTAFEFRDDAEARRLLTFYFGPLPEEMDVTHLSYRVGLFAKRSAGAVPQER